MPAKPLELKLLAVTPDRLDVADVLTLLKAYRDTLVAMYPEPESLPAGPAVALVGIKKGSSRYQIHVANRLKPAVSSVARAVLNNDFTPLPSAARRSLKALVASLKESGRSLQLPAYRRRTPLLTGSTVIVLKESESLTGQTTLFGRVRLTGGGRGIDTGRAELVLGDNTVVRLVGPRDIIKKLASNLYDEVGVNGVATWDSATNVPFQMQVSGLHEFPAGDDVASAFERLAIAAGDHWDDIDAETYVSELRSDEL